MVDTYRMADDAQSKLRDTADRVSETAHNMADQANETIRKAADRVNDAAKGGLKTAKEFADAAQQFVQDSGIGDVNVRELVEREPWLALGVAFAVGFAVAQVMRRISS
ncbi:MAG TPA: hypothetical protein VKV03_11770 [Candidatus Binataceae bacterium]|nr:hypothetical protein [Candidatus Binataceae bacterium]